MNEQIGKLLKKYSRQLERYQKKEADLEQKKESLSVHGYWSLWYAAGRVMLLQDIIDDLKDLAFEKERAKFRRTLRELEQENRRLLAAIQEKDEKIHNLEVTLEEYKDWNMRLMEYMDMSEDAMREKLEHDGEITRLLKQLEELYHIRPSFDNGRK